MTNKFFRTTNSHAALPFGALTADGAPDGTEDHPYSAYTQIATELAAGNDVYLHPACFWVMDGAAFLSLSSAEPALGGTLQRWEIAGYEEWFPTIENVIRPASWTAVGGGSGRWTYTLSGTMMTADNEVVALGGHLVGDGRGVEYRSALTRCRMVSPITSATTPGDFLVVSTDDSPDYTTFTVYTGTDSEDPIEMFGGFCFCTRNTAWSRSIAMSGSKRLTLTDLQLIGGGLRSEPGDGVTCEDITLVRPRHIGSSYIAVQLTPSHANGLVQDWVIDRPNFDAGSHLDSPPVGVNSSMSTNNGISIQRRVRDVEIRDPKIAGFSHSQIQALCVPGDTTYIDGDFGWPYNIVVRKTTDAAGFNELTGGRGYRRGIVMCGHGWVVDRQHIIGQSSQSQFSGRGVLIMPRWSEGYHTEASNTNYGSGSGFGLQIDTAGVIPQRITMLSPVFDEVPNFPGYLPGNYDCPSGALDIRGALVRSLDTYTPKYQPNGASGNTTWNDPAPFFAGRNYTDASGTGDAQGIPFGLRDSVFIIPSGQTAIAALQTAGETGTSPGTWTKRYTAATSNADVSGNQTFNTEAAAGFDENLAWIGTARPALPRRVR